MGHISCRPTAAGNHLFVLCFKPLIICIEHQCFCRHCTLSFLTGFVVTAISFSLLSAGTMFPMSSLTTTVSPTLHSHVDCCSLHLSKVWFTSVFSPLAVKQLSVITSALNSFSVSTCIRFIPRVNHVDYIYIQSLSGCYSYVGRQGKAQTLSLNSRSCIRIGIVQHELLHALGFHHEQSRSDRDDHIQILKGNILTSLLYNFKKVSTLNQGTPYDYDSVMHYGRLAFSKDNVSPTMEAYPDANVTFGLAKEMSQNDIQRVNRLYCLK
uniref:Metalloendopeptidase n=1 Tax=Monopterus albus TaxID=43700 RepID=A0A3Q3JIY4_MONAL